MAAAIVDAGPLVAFLDAAEAHHQWVAEQLTRLDTPLLVCEPVLSETLHLLKRKPVAQDMVFEMVEDGTLSVEFHVEDCAAPLRQLHWKYRDVPMSLANACIVLMAELHQRQAAFTLDSDFAIYRKHGRTSLTLIRPA